MADIKEFWKHLAFGLTSVGSELPVPDSVVSMFNGVPLPNIPFDYVLNIEPTSYSDCVVIVNGFTKTYTNVYSKDPTERYSASGYRLLKGSLYFSYNNGKFSTTMSNHHCYTYNYDTDTNTWDGGSWGFGYEDAPAYKETFTTDEIVWANYDILDESGNVYLPTSTPVPIIAESAVGFNIGQKLRVSSRNHKEPVAYFYPSVVLPELPEWDVKSYPYAYLYITSNKRTVFACFDKPLLYKDEYDFKVVIEEVIETITFSECFLVEKETSGVTYKYTKGANTFEGPTEYHAPEVDTVLFSSASSKQDINFGKAEPLWTNTPLVKGDGSVYFSASTPVTAGNGMVAYKGVRLPKLPEWDDKTYKYYSIVHTVGLPQGDKYEYILYMYDTPFYFVDEYKSPNGIVVYNYLMWSNLAYGIRFYRENGEWVYDRTTYGNLYGYFDDLVWVNFDVCDENNSVKLPTTDPIPIYE